MKRLFLLLLSLPLVTVSCRKDSRPEPEPAVLEGRWKLDSLQTPTIRAYQLDGTVFYNGPALGSLPYLLITATTTQGQDANGISMSSPFAYTRQGNMLIYSVAPPSTSVSTILNLTNERLELLNVRLNPAPQAPDLAARTETHSWYVRARK